MSLEEKVANELKRAGETIPVASLSYSETVARGKRSRRVYLASVAAAAALVLAGGSFGVYQLVAERTPRGSGVTNSPSPDESPEASIPAAQANAAVQAFIDAVHVERAAAWAMLTPESQANLDREGFLADTGFSEGLGVWAVEPYRSEAEFSFTPVDQEVGVVTVSGPFPDGEDTVPAAHAFVVRGRGERLAIEFRYDVAYLIHPQVPGYPSAIPYTISGSEPLIARIGPNRATIDDAVGDARSLRRVLMAIDGDPEVVSTSVRETGREAESLSVTGRITEPVSPGEHVLTIIAVDGRGVVMSHALVFQYVES